MVIGHSLTLPPESEEVAGFFAAMVETDHAQDKTFQENFFRDFKVVLEKYPPVGRSLSDSRWSLTTISERGNQSHVV